MFYPLLHNNAFWHLCENIMENKSFAPKKQMLQFSIFFSKVFKALLFFLEFLKCCLKIKKMLSGLETSLGSQGLSTVKPVLKGHSKKDKKRY